MTRPFPILVSSALLAVAPFLAAQSIDINHDNRTVAIHTTDEATATADIAAITIGFEVFKADADSASTEGGRRSQAIIDALHKDGVDDKSIESGTQGISRNTEFNDKETAAQRAQRQYRFQQNWIVSVSPNNAAEVLRAALAAGANQSGSIEWRLSDRKGLQARAAANALIKARSVAEQMAEGLHVKLGDLIYAGNQAPNSNIFPVAMNRLTANSEASVSAAKTPPPPPLEIRPQTMREEASVYAVFSIE